MYVGDILVSVNESKGNRLLVCRRCYSNKLNISCVTRGSNIELALYDLSFFSLSLDYLRKAMFLAVP